MLSLRTFCNLLITISDLQGSFGRFSTWSWQFISMIASFPTSSSVNWLQFFCKFKMTRWVQTSSAPFGAFMASRPCLMNSSFSLGSSNSTCGRFLRSVSELMSSNKFKKILGLDLLKYIWFSRFYSIYLPLILGQNELAPFKKLSIKDPWAEYDVIVSKIKIKAFDLIILKSLNVSVCANNLFVYLHLFSSVCMFTNLFLSQENVCKSRFELKI